jgi:hypothetical protein
MFLVVLPASDFIAIMNRQSSESQDRVKRRKIAVACDDCRARKVRCDGVQPSMLLMRPGTGPVLMRPSVWAMQQKDRTRSSLRLYRGIGEEKSTTNASLNTFPMFHQIQANAGYM